MLSSLVPITGTLVWMVDLSLKAYYANSLVFFSFPEEVEESVEGEKLEEVTIFSHTSQVSILASIINHLAAAITTGLACVSFARDQIWYNSSFFTIDTLHSDG